MGQPYPSAVPPARRLNEADRIAAIGHARAAVALGNDDATALAIAALVIAYDGHDIAMALRVFDRVLELSNCNVFVLCWNAAILAWIGKAELAIERPAGAPTGTVRFVDLASESCAVDCVFSWPEIRRCRQCRSKLGRCQSGLQPSACNPGGRVHGTWTRRKRGRRRRPCWSASPPFRLVARRATPNSNQRCPGPLLMAGAKPGYPSNAGRGGATDHAFRRGGRSSR